MKTNTADDNGLGAQAQGTLAMCGRESGTNDRDGIHCGADEKMVAAGGGNAAHAAGNATSTNVAGVVGIEHGSSSDRCIAVMMADAASRSVATTNKQSAYGGNMSRTRSVKGAADSVATVNGSVDAAVLDGRNINVVADADSGAEAKDMPVAAAGEVSSAPAKAKRKGRMRTIYPPRGRAGEYAHLALNHYEGCSHGCHRYCWAAKLAKLRGSKTFHTHQELRPGFLEELRRVAPKFSGTNRRVLVNFTTDPYQPLDDEMRATRSVLSILREHDVPFEILTKGGMRAVRDFDLYGPNDAFASTLTFVDPEKSLAWEPGAALPADRFAALQEAHRRSIFTWASLEPVIDPEESLAVIDATHEYVQHYKLGTLNYVANNTDWREYGISAIGKCQEYGRTFYVKDDLAKHLAGVEYVNTDIRSVQRQVPQQC